MKINIQRTSASRIDTVDFGNIPFGRIFSDHLVECNYSDGKWGDIHIKPYDNFSLSPACSALHYGQAIFEGMKAYYDVNGKIVLFRPEKNAKRLNTSAKRLDMPAFPVEDFLKALRSLVDIDKAWVPNEEGKSLYIRPYMFGNDAYIGVRTSENYKFVIFTCPVGAYYAEPVRVKVAEKYVRAFQGGTGYTKCAGNYGATLYPASLAKKEGFDQILWTDGNEHKYVHEIGTMNVFFVINGSAITPSVDGNILEGVTRDSVITLLKDENIKIEERPISIEEIMEAGEAGTLTDAFGTGTAASISYINSIDYKGHEVTVPVKGQHVASLMKKRMADIRLGREKDKFGWIQSV